MIRSAGLQNDPKSILVNENIESALTLRGRGRNPTSAPTGALARGAILAFGRTKLAPMG
jgi:hypothetical protein